MLIRDFPHHLPDYELSRRQVIRDRCVLEERLRSIRSLTVFPSRANFVFVRVPESVDGTELRNVLLTEFGCLVRECGNKSGCDHHYFRIAARPAEQVGFLIESFNAVLERLSPQRWRAKSVPPGTTDHESGRLPALAS
jgi:histidinol-phosphate/aromatic aminotransferase/cobyric acid decarboxylase-like protein